MNESTLVPRKDESDLDWLARNVHKWKSGYDLAVVQRGGGEIYVTWPSVCSSGITKKQWLTRRAELQNKPSWKGAPGWANWLAQDSDGEWFWFENKPWSDDADFRTSGGGVMFAVYGGMLGNWYDTLEKRPEQDEFEPFVSVEDIGAVPETAGQQYRREIGEIAVNKYNDAMKDTKISIMQGGGGIKDHGGAFDRFLFIKEDAATAKQPAITPSKYTKTINGVSVDVYDVLQAWNVINPALQHLIKKALQCGQRGHKDNAQDLQDIIDSAIRAKELDS